MKKFFPLLIILLFICNYKFTIANKNPSSNNNFNFIVPKILSEEDKKIYLEINKLQISGNWEEEFIV